MDGLILLIVLMAVVMITWIAISCMEIEQLKISVSRKLRYIEVIPVRGDRKPEAQSKAPNIASEASDGNINPTDLDKNKIYYLCHPCTTGTRTIEENKNREECLYQRIIGLNPGVKIIRPLVLIPDGMDHQEAMQRCFNLIDASHAIILPLGWQKSNGCKMEHRYSITTDTERVYINAS